MYVRTYVSLLPSTSFSIAPIFHIGHSFYFLGKCFWCVFIYLLSGNYENTQKCKQTNMYIRESRRTETAYKEVSRQDQNQIPNIIDSYDIMTYCAITWQTSHAFTCSNVFWPDVPKSQIRHYAKNTRNVRNRRLTLV